jgi:spore maturation protein CgeB
VLVAHGGDDVAACLQSLTRERAQAIGAAARRRVLAHHTYEQRAALVQAALDGLVPSRVASTVEARP